MFKKILILPAALFAFACGGDKKVDDALNSDLSTAAQAQPYTPLDSITAAERARAGVRVYVIVDWLGCWRSLAVSIAARLGA